MSLVTLAGLLNSSDNFKLCYLQTSPASMQETVSFVSNKRIPVLNLGYQLASYINSLKSRKFISLEVHEELSRVLHAKKTRLPDTTVDVIALYNFGILLEPELDLNPVKILSDFSRSAALILIWEYQISQEGILHWPDQPITNSFDFSKTHIRKLHYEV